MPANRRTLALTEQFHDRVAALAVRTSQLVMGRFNAIDPDDLTTGLRLVVGHAAGQIELGQRVVTSLADGYVRAASRLEVGETTVAEPLEGNAGTTADGRRLTEGLASTPAKILLAIKHGRSLDEALKFGRFSLGRFAHTEVMDASRLELTHQAEALDEIRGWRWRSRGTCEACLALDDGRVRDPSSTVKAHPFCECVPELTFDVEENVQRETGHERFEAMSVDEQDAILGEQKATLLRAGAIAWSDLFVVQESNDWRDVLTAAPMERLLQKAGISSNDGDSGA